MSFFANEKTGQYVLIDNKHQKHSDMKKIITLIIMLLSLNATADAMSYEQAREQALFLTDKMAYELNLTEEQYDAAYEVNLDYLMSINTPDDLYEAYWRQRNIDLSYILLDWQYRAFCAASYFYRPLYWTSGVWHFAIYSRYPRRHYLYFGRTNIFITYRGGHSWHHNGGRSWYKGRTFHHGKTDKWYGLKDRFDRGDFRHGVNNQRPRPDKHSRSDNKFRGNNDMLTKRPQNDTKQRPGLNFNGNRRNFRNNRESSTRTTARPDRGIKISNGSTQRRPSNIFTPKISKQRTTINKSSGNMKSLNKAKRSSNGQRKQPGGNKGGSRSGRFGGKR